MSGEKNNNNPFWGQNTASSVLVTLIISSFVICILYTIYRHLHRFLERPNANNPWRSRPVPTVDLDQKPVLWDVYIEGGKPEWQWLGSKPLSTDVTPTAPRTQNHQQGHSREEREVLNVSAIVVLPSQRNPEPVGTEETLKVWAIGTTSIRCRGYTPST